MAATTARRYLEYLRISYQAFELPPFSRNLTSTVIKTPKLFWLDVGLWRHLTRSRGPATGSLFETLAVAEVYKWVKTHDLPVDLYFYRTRSGLEVDLLAATAHGIWTFEMKQGAQLSSSAWSGMGEVGAALGKEWRGGIVIYSGTSIQKLGANLWAVPVERLLV